MQQSEVNALGEKLRNWCFVGEGTGCYSNFELREGFSSISPESELGKKLLALLEYDEEFYEVEGYKPTPYLYVHEAEQVFLAWYWDGDGTLLVGRNGQWVINTDCKTDYCWELVEPEEFKIQGNMHILEGNPYQGVKFVVGSLQRG